MKKKIKRIVIIVLIILVGIGIFSGVSYYRNSKAKDTTPLETVLEKSSDLTTQKLVITDVFECSKGKVPILTKNNFLVRYQTTVTAGFDVNKAEIKETDNGYTLSKVTKDGKKVQDGDTFTVTCLAIPKHMEAYPAADTVVFDGGDTTVKATWTGYVSDGAAVLAEPEDYMTLR